MDEELEYEPRMSASDALMWCIEKDPLLRSTITTITLLDRAPDRDRLQRRLERATWRIPRLRQRVVGHPYSIAPPRWELDPNFDLSFHLRWMRAPGDGSLREALEIAEPIAMQGFDRARPLWEAVIIEGLTDGRAAIVQKIHHAITDGVGGVKIQMELLDLERDPTEEADHVEDLGGIEGEVVRPLSEPERVLDAVAFESGRALRSVRRATEAAVHTARQGVSDPVGVGVNALHLGASVAKMLAPTTRPLSPLMRRRSLSVRFDTKTFDLASLKRAAHLAGGRLNDAFVAGVAGSFRRYHLLHGEPVERLRMTMPISIRTDQTAALAGNQFVPARFQVPIGIDDPIALMTRIRELIEAERSEPALALTEPIAAVLNRLPASATTAVFGSMLKGMDFVTTNVPGPPVPVYFAGAQVLGQYAFAPMIGAAANIALLSYVGELNVGINTDPAAIPDPEVFLTCVDESFEELAALG